MDVVSLNDSGSTTEEEDPDATIMIVSEDEEEQSLLGPQRPTVRNIYLILGLEYHNYYS